jgi:hypothetical protein
MPDMVRNFLKGRKLEPTDQPAHTDEQEWLRIGSNKHFERDKRFHGSHFFKTNTHLVTQKLRPVFQSANIKRDWFAAHLLTEMMIDRVLIAEIPLLAEQFYKDTESASHVSIADFLIHRNIDETEQFLQRLNRFNQAKYLLQYQHNKALVYSLNRIFIQTGADTEWNENQFNLLEPVMEEIEIIVLDNLQNLKNEML